jgi:hypothetical protein
MHARSSNPGAGWLREPACGHYYVCKSVASATPLPLSLKVPALGLPLLYGAIRGPAARPM